MAFPHRKLMSDSSSDNGTSSTDYCAQWSCYQCCSANCTQYCLAKCLQFGCLNLCPNPYSPSPTGSESGSNGKTTAKLLIITFAVLSVAFLVLCYYIYYVKFSRARSNARRRSQPETTETLDGFLDENQGPIVDHHIWYINTVGLQPSIINSITVFKYKSGEGLVEGTDCSVCLNEFEEDETLRLLPKCSHAFHLPCIDTWLRSHTNCPMCRAPIVSSTANKEPSSSEANANDSGESEEELQVVIREDDREQPDRETEGETSEIRVRTEEEEEFAVENESKTGESSGAEDGIQQTRRSVSLDSLAASQISQTVANGLPEGSNGNSDNEVVKGKESSVRIVSRRAAGNQSLRRLLCHSSIGRSLQTKPIFMKRSFSCNGKFSLPISNNKGRNKNLPPRSF